MHHTPLWVKIGMAAGFAYLGLYGINMVGDMFGGGSGGHGTDTHVASTEHAGEADHGAAEEQHAAPDPYGADPYASADDHGEAEDAAGSVVDAVEEAAEEVVAAIAGDAEKGAKTAKKKCGTCHTFKSGEKNKVGPNLWAVAGAGKAAQDGYKYSGALKAMGGTWTDEDLAAFLTSPKGFVKGTKMAFKGLNKANEHADVMAYLKTLQ